MPIVAIDNIIRPEHLVEYLAELFETNLKPPFNFIAKYDEHLVPEYPCLHVQPGPYAKSYDGLATHELYLTAYLYVMHDTLTKSRRVRNYEDLLLATQVVEFLENDITLGRRVIDCIVSDETPAVVPPHSPKTPAMVSTRLQLVCRNKKRFK